MIKSLKIKNSSSYFEEQEIKFFDSYDDPNKNLNYIFGLSASGKSSFFNLFKATVYYMRRWITFTKGDIFSISRSLNLQSYFNPNINSIKSGVDNETCIEMIFSNEEWEYKYELRFHEFACNLEKFSYRKANSNDEWIIVFNKFLLSCDLIDTQYESIFNYEINWYELGLDFDISLSHKDLNDSIFLHIVSMDKTKRISPIIDIVESIVFFETKNFQTLNNFLLPQSLFISKRKEILNFLQKMEINFTDLSLSQFNKLTGIYELNLFLNTNGFSEGAKHITSSKLSKGELKLLILSYLYVKYQNENKIIVIDEFSSKIKYSNFLSMLKILDNNLSTNNKFQFICWNGQYFDEIKKNKTSSLNIFNTIKTSNNYSVIKKVTDKDLDTEKEEEISKLKRMLNVQNISDENLDVNRFDIYEEIIEENNLSNDFEEEIEEEQEEVSNDDLMDYPGDYQDESLYDDEYDELSEEEIAKMSRQENDNDSFDLKDLKDLNTSFLSSRAKEKQAIKEFEEELDNVQLELEEIIYPKK